MEIYFAAAIRGGRDDVEIYLEIINYLKKYGDVLTEHIGDKNISSQGEIKLDARTIYGRDMDWISQAKVIVGEVSTPSLGVGCEIMKSVCLGKKVLCLYRPQDGKRLSAMIAGCPQIVNKNYNSLDDAKRAIDEFFSSLKI